MDFAKSQNTVNFLYCEWKKIDRSAKDEICSSVRYEQKLKADGFKAALNMVAKLLDAQNPLDLCRCGKCKLEYIFAELEDSGGICPACVDQ
jgi:hypothetical protein